MTPEERTAQQWAQIVALLRAEMGHHGKIAPVQDVRPSAHLWTGVTPAIGVQLLKIHVEPEFTHKHHTFATFVILVSVQSHPITTKTSTVPPNLDDANAQLQTILADGNGKGVCNILRDPANFLLGQDENGQNLAIRTLVSGIDYSWEIGPGADGSDQVWANALVTYVVEDLISVA